MERMSNNSGKIKVKPLSRKKIREIVIKIKNFFKISDGKIDIIKFIEIASVVFGFDYEYVEDNKLSNKYAETDPKNKKISIRESVYMGAIQGNPRDRFTIAHELGHIILHCLLNSEVKYCRFDEEIKPYEDIEWQANTFAGEFLVNSETIKELEIEEIMERYVVSKAVAEIQKQKF